MQCIWYFQEIYFLQGILLNCIFQSCFLKVYFGYIIFKGVFWKEMLRWQSYQDLPDEEMRSRREDILTHQERKCSLEERRRQVEEEARRSSLEEQRRIHLRKEEEKRISLEAEVFKQSGDYLVWMGSSDQRGRKQNQSDKILFVLWVGHIIFTDQLCHSDFARLPQLISRFDSLYRWQGWEQRQRKGRKKWTSLKRSFEMRQRDKHH